MSATMKIQMVLQAIDKATGPMRNLAQTVNRMNSPFKRLEGISSGVAYRLGRMWGHKLGSAIAASADKGRAAWEQLGRTMSVVMRGSLAAAAAIAGGGFAAKKSLGRMSEIKDTAAMLGIGTEELQAYGYAADQAGSSNREFGEALRHLSQSMGEAITGNSEMVELFQHIGLSVGDLKRMNALEVFKAMSDKFESVGDGAGNASRKFQVMQAALGKTGPRLKQFLDAGSGAMKKSADRAIELKLLLGDALVQAGADAEDSMNTLGGVIRTRFDEVVGRAAPGILKLVEALSKLVSNVNLGDLGSKLSEMLSNLADRLPGIVEDVLAFGRGISEAWGKIDGVVQALGGWTQVMNILGAGLIAKVVISIAQFAAVLTQAGLAMSLATVGLTPFTLAAGLLAAAGVLIWRNWEPLKSFFSDLFDGALKKIQDLVSWAGRLGSALTGGGGGPFGGSSLVPSLGEANQSVGSIGGGAASVGGTLKIEINDPSGRARVAEIKRASPAMDLEVGYSGAAMGGFA